MKSVDYRIGEKVTIYCLAGNLLLSIFKGLAGYFGGSKVMVADAFHSGSDVLATFVVFVCIKIAKKPADDCHMYGHGKIEPLAAALVSFIMLFTAALIVRNIIHCLVAQEFVTPSPLALAAAVVSIIVKEIMFRVTYQTGKKINSEAITATAWDHRADAWSSIGTFIAILGSIIGGSLQIDWLKYFDPLAGILVALLIFRTAVAILLKAAKGLMDASPEPEKVKEIKNITENIEGVRAVSWIRGRYLGQHIIIDMAIEVNSAMTVEEGHNIAALIKRQLMDAVPEVGDVVVHVNPYRDDGRGEEKAAAIPAERP